MRSGRGRDLGMGTSEDRALRFSSHRDIDRLDKSGANRSYRSAPSAASVPDEEGYQRPEISRRVKPPAQTSGLLLFIRLMPFLFVGLNMVLLFIGLASSAQGASCSMDLGLPSGTAPALLLGLELAYCMGLLLLQVHVRLRMRISVEDIMQQQARLKPLAASRGPAGERSPQTTFSAFAQWWRGEPSHDYVSGSYYLPKRKDQPSHYQLLQTYYSEYLYSNPTSLPQLCQLVAGVLQVFEMGIFALQPGLLRMCFSSEKGSPGLSHLLHQAWINLAILVIVSALHFWNFRWLIRNALHTATGERDWLAHDLLQERKDKEQLFLSSIDNLEERDGALELICGNEYELVGNDGHLNLTYAWMCASTAANSFGAAYTAQMCSAVAAQTQEMVEGSSNYKFKLRSVAAWDINKLCLLCQALQAVTTVLASSELVGSSLFRNIWFFATTGIVLGTYMATRSAVLAARYCFDRDIGQGGRLFEVNALAGFMAMLAVLIWMWAIFSLFLRFAACYDKMFSVLTTLMAQELVCKSHPP